MAYLILILVIQLACVVHVIRTGRNPLWILGIMIAPILGALAYFLFEILPGMQGNRHVRYAKKKAIAKIDPERDIRIARDQLEVTDSIANRTSLADALSAAGQHDEALEHYERIFATPHGQDDILRFKYAATLFEKGRSGDALQIFEQIGIVAQTSAQDRRFLLKARILESLDRDEESAAIYADITTRLAGIEARSRYAALLIKMGQSGSAKIQLEEVLRATRKLDRTQIGDDQPILDWTKMTLKDLPN